TFLLTYISTITYYYLLLSCISYPLLHSFPTRRSSDLNNQSKGGTFSFYVDNKRYEIEIDKTNDTLGDIANKINDAAGGKVDAKIDRKSTRLNSSHVSISYAVFCLKNKNQKKYE